MARTLFDNDQVVDEDFISPNENLDNPPYTWSYGDSDERTDATGFEYQDLGKLAFDEDTRTLWILIEYDPPAWVPVGTDPGHVRSHSLTDSDDHYDVEGTPEDGYVLIWNQALGKWIPGDVLSILSSGVMDNDGNSVFDNEGELVRVVI